MSISMYQASVPVFSKTLSHLSAILDKAAAFADSRKIDSAVLLNYRLAPDMFNFTRQVQIACDFAKGSGSRLAGNEPPVYEDNETSLAELKARIDKTIALLNTLQPAQIDGSETRDIHVKMRGEPVSFKGQPYLLHFVLPNFFFHVTTAYAILRHCGVEIGKRDFIGSV